MRHMMRGFANIFLAVSGLALLSLCCAAFAQEHQEAQVVDAIAAVVNEDVITFSQVRTLSAPREELLRAQSTVAELENKLKEARQAALKDLMDRRLIIVLLTKDSFQ